MNVRTIQTITIITSAIWAVVALTMAGCHDYKPQSEVSQSSGADGWQVIDPVCSSPLNFGVEMVPNYWEAGTHVLRSGQTVSVEETPVGDSVRFGEISPGTYHTEEVCLSGAVCRAQAEHWGTQGPLPITLGWVDQNNMGDRIDCEDESRGFDPRCVNGFNAGDHYRPPSSPYPFFGFPNLSHSHPDQEGTHVHVRDSSQFGWESHEGHDNWPTFYDVVPTGTIVNFECGECLCETRR